MYSNREYVPENPDETVWTRNKQYVDLEVKFTPAARGLTAGVRVAWEAEDPDDPSDEGMSGTSGEIVDANDYDSVDSDGDGSDEDGNDNTGVRDAEDVWEQLDEDYALSGNETMVKEGVSKVRFHVTDDGGDNFMVKAKIKPRAGATSYDGAETGLMTVWKLIQLENTKMPSGNNLPFANLNSHFEKCFVSWDVQDTRSVPDKDPMGADEAAASAACDEYVQAPPVGEFTRAGDGGWFFMASAGRYVPEAGQQSKKLIDYTTDGDSFVLVDGIIDPEFPHVGGEILLPKEIPAEEQVDYIRIYKEDGSANIIFAPVGLSEDRDKVFVVVPDYQPEDDPNGHNYRYLRDHGFDSGTWRKVNVYSPGEVVTGGISPPIREGANRFFQGRTIVFKFGNLETMVHELIHGLGMAHMCGNEDHTGSETCLMTYDWNWLKDASGDLIPWSGWNCGLEPCARHISHIRKANLEDDSSAKGRRLGW